MSIELTGMLFGLFAAGVFAVLVGVIGYGALRMIEGDDESRAAHAPSSVREL